MNASKRTSSKYNDEELLVWVAAGHRGAFEALFRRFAMNLNRLAYSRLGNAPDSEKMIQEIFVRLWMDRRGLNNIKAVEAFLVQLVNVGIGHYHQSGKMRKDGPGLLLPDGKELLKKYFTGMATTEEKKLVEDVFRMEEKKFTWSFDQETEQLKRIVDQIQPGHSTFPHASQQEPWKWFIKKVRSVFR